MSTVVISPPNAILFVFDPTVRGMKIPVYVDGQLTAANGMCISVGTQAEIDGETSISLEETEPRDPGLARAFQGAITTPGRLVAVVTAEAEQILKLPVQGIETVISIWADDPRNPARLVISVQ